MAGPSGRARPPAREVTAESVSPHGEVTAPRRAHELAGLPTEGHVAGDGAGPRSHPQLHLCSEPAPPSTILFRNQLERS